jgi:hypothetical protein
MRYVLALMVLWFAPVSFMDDDTEGFMSKSVVERGGKCPGGKCPPKRPRPAR